MGFGKSQLTMFAQGSRVVADIDILHKCAGHVSVQWLKAMQNQDLVTGLLVLKVAKIPKLCEAFQFERNQKPHFLMISM